MPFVIQHFNGTFIAKKDAWSTSWSGKLDDARIFPSVGGATRASKTLNDGYCKPKHNYDYTKTVRVGIYLKP
jgi:hypothetical protein